MKRDFEVKLVVGGFFFSNKFPYSVENTFIVFEFESQSEVLIMVEKVEEE